MRFLVAPLALRRLLLEAAALVDRVVELGVGIGELAPAHVELEAVHQPRLPLLLLGERGQLDREVHHEGGLHERGLDERVEDLLPQRDRAVLATQDGLGLPIGREPAAACRGRPERARVGLGRDRAAEGLAESLEEGQPPPRRGQTDGLALICELVPPHQGLAQVDEELLGELHEVLVVGVGLVELQHRELGVVLGRHPLVAEVAVDLVHALEPAHHEALEIELGGDA